MTTSATICAEAEHSRQRAPYSGPPFEPAWRRGSSRPCRSSAAERPASRAPAPWPGASARWAQSARPIGDGAGLPPVSAVSRVPSVATSPVSSGFLSTSVTAPSELASASRSASDGDHQKRDDGRRRLWRVGVRAHLVGAGSSREHRDIRQHDCAYDRTAGVASDYGDRRRRACRAARIRRHPRPRSRESRSRASRPGWSGRARHRSLQVPAWRPSAVRSQPRRPRDHDSRRRRLS